MHRSGRIVSAAAATAVCLLAGCSDKPAGPTGADSRGAVQGPVVVTVGDIACEPGDEVTATTCQHAATAELAGAFDPRIVLTLGDVQYNDGELADFESVYAKSWGRFRPITKPVLGNHEYDSEDASGYFSYFEGETPASGHYAFNINGWRIYALDSNCSETDCDTQAAWLDHDMQRHPRACTAIAMHHPRYSSDSKHGDQPSVQPFWQVAIRHHADLALAAHAHDYERFRAMDADGHVTRRGLVSFVVGTGGKSLYTSGAARKGSVIYYNHRAGVLALRLGHDRYTWEFRNIDGRTVDSGTHSCH